MRLARDVKCEWEPVENFCLEVGLLDLAIFWTRDLVRTPDRLLERVVKLVRGSDPKLEKVTLQKIIMIWSNVCF